MKLDFKSERPNSVNFTLFFDLYDPLIVKKSKLVVLKKIQTYLKPFKQLQFLNILFHDPCFASNIASVYFFLFL